MAENSPSYKKWDLSTLVEEQMGRGRGESIEFPVFSSAVKRIAGSGNRMENWLSFS